jgi:hypothetical protein
MAMLYDVAEARREAPIHVQIELTDLPTPIPELREIKLTGFVVTVFRGSSLLQIGSVVSFPIWICPRGKEPTGPAFVYRDVLMRLGYVEAYLSGEPPDCRLVGYECRLISTPSLHPQLPVELEEADRATEMRERSEVARPTWWQFWRK